MLLLCSFSDRITKEITAAEKLTRLPVRGGVYFGDAVLQPLYLQERLLISCIPPPGKARDGTEDESRTPTDNLLLYIGGAVVSRIDHGGPLMAALLFDLPSTGTDSKKKNTAADKHRSAPLLIASARTPKTTIHFDLPPLPPGWGLACGYSGTPAASAGTPPSPSPETRAPLVMTPIPAPAVTLYPVLAKLLEPHSIISMCLPPAAPAITAGLALAQSMHRLQHPPAALHAQERQTLQGFADRARLSVYQRRQLLTAAVAHKTAAGALPPHSLFKNTESLDDILGALDAR